MGWDAFGLPAENAAIERSIHPNEWTIKNIGVMKNQMEKILADFDWDRASRHIDPCCRVTLARETASDSTRKQYLQYILSFHI